MSLLLITSDIHLSDNPRDSYRYDWTRWFTKLVEERKPHAVLILGDLTEKKDEHAARLVNDVVSFIWRLAQTCRVIVLQGNHDYVSNPKDGYWFFLNSLENVHYVITPWSTVVGGLDCLFLPHTRDYQKDWEKVDLKSRDWIFCHNTFQGAHGGFGHVLEGIPISVLPSNADVISGDVHVPQTFGPLTYVGAPYLCDFGDDYEPRILAIEGSAVKSIPCPGAQKRLVEITDPVELKLHKLNKGDIAKVRVNLKMSDREDWPAMKAEIDEWAQANGVKIDSSTPHFDLSKGKRIRLSPRGNRSDEDTLKTYAQVRAVSGEVLEAGLTIIKE